MNITTICDFRHAIRSPYAWPGGYPCYFIMSDGEALSFASARKEARRILESIRDRSDDGWRVVAVEINYEDGDLLCCHSGERIESAYAEPDQS